MINEKFQEYIESQEKDIDKALGLMRYSEKGKVVKKEYLGLRKEQFEMEEDLDNHYSNWRKYFGSKSTPIKRVILDTVGGDLISVKEAREQDLGINPASNLGKLERQLVQVNLELPAYEHLDFPRNLMPREIKISEHEKGYSISVEYVETRGERTPKPCKDTDRFEVFSKQIFGKGGIFMRFDTPIGDCLTHSGGTWALGMSSTTQENDRYGGLLAIQEVEGDSKENAKSWVNKISRRINNFMVVEREGTIKGFRMADLLLRATEITKKLTRKDVSYLINVRKEYDTARKMVEQTKLQEIPEI